MELWVKRYDRLTIRDQFVKKIITNGALAEKQIASFLEIRFPERKAHSNPKKRKNTLSVIESTLSSNTLSRGENDFAPGARPLIQRGAPRLVDRWGPEAGSTRAGPAWPSFSSRSGSSEAAGGDRPDGDRRRVRPPLATADLPTSSGERGASPGGLGCRRGAREKKQQGTRRRGASGSGGHGVLVGEAEGRRAREDRRGVARPSMGSDWAGDGRRERMAEGDRRRPFGHGGGCGAPRRVGRL